VYNILTPNNDGKNDFFTVSGVRAPDVQIYNRWGRKLEDFKAYDNKWNGGSLSGGMYYYLATDPLTKQQYKGWFEIVR
jgi:gliding motility-associated-like protein